jgi:hypothetical protein
LVIYFFFFFLGPVCISSGSTAAFKAYCVLVIYLVNRLKWEHIASADMRKFMLAVDGKLEEALAICSN